MTLNGTYTPPLPPPLPPFAAPDFTLSLTIPAQVSVDATGPVLTAFRLDGISGSYTNGGQTTNFSDDFVIFGTPFISTADTFSIVVSNLLVPADTFMLSFQADAALFSPATFVSGMPETFALGGFTVVSDSSSATYTADPGFSGAGSISRQVTVPEPASVSLLLPALAGLWLARRRDHSPRSARCG
jgi:hypothetical protein